MSPNQQATYRTADHRFAAFMLAALLTLGVFASVNAIATAEPPAALVAQIGNAGNAS